MLITAGETRRDLSRRKGFPLRPICLLVTLAFPLLSSGAEVDRFAGLLAKSPFGLGREEAPSASEPAPEFRGYVYTDSIVLFNIAHPDSAGRIRSVWVELGEPNTTDFVVQSFDHASDTLDVLHQGKRISIKLSHARNLAPSALFPPATNVNPDGTPDEQTQVEHIVAEIARRRALRQRAAQSNAQPEDG